MGEVPIGADAARPTMRDVAALAGVALKTVSRVMNGVPSVDPALAARVRAAADKLAYRPNLAANLRSGRTNTVGLLLEDIGNPFSAATLRAIEDELEAAGILLLAASLDEKPSREEELTRRLIDRRVDGLIVVPASRDQRYIVAEQLRGTCVVFLDRLPQPLVADAVVSDNRVGARRGVEHLMRHGRRRIAYLGDDPAIPTATERYRGYLDAMAGQGLTVDPALVRHGLRSVQEAHRAAADLLAGPGDAGIDAVFTSQNLVTIGAVGALHAAGRHREVAQVGFDDIPFAEALEPGVTVVAQDTRMLGRTAAERLLARIHGDRSAPQVFSVPSRLLVRGSGELPVSAGEN